MFTIEVEKKGKDEEFTLEDLEMYHEECYGGKIEATDEDLLSCKRCGYFEEIDKDIALTIIKTVIDGQERKTKYAWIVVRRI